MPPYDDAFEDRVQVAIRNIEPDGNGGSTPSSITFTPYDNPDIGVDTSGRFATHDIIGGYTVRQKIGADPVEITVTGVCDESTAKELDQLRNARSGQFLSDRISMVVQVASVGTDPMESGGAVNMDDFSSELLYSYTLNLVGIDSISEEGAVPTGPPSGAFQNQGSDVLGPGGTDLPGEGDQPISPE